MVKSPWKTIHCKRDKRKQYKSYKKDLQDPREDKVPKASEHNMQVFFVAFKK
jgi:hypothetical protein